MMGSTIRPGITHSEATEKPGRPSPRRDRQREGDEDAGTEHGQRRRDHAVDADRDDDVRAQPRNRSRRSTWPTATLDRKRIRPRMLPRNRRVTMRAPSTRPTSWNGSAIAAAMPRARSSSPNSCSYSNEASVDEADERRGQERQAPPDPLEALDLLHRSPALGVRRRGFLGGDHLVAGAHRLAFPPPADRLAESQGDARRRSSSG